MLQRSVAGAAEQQRRRPRPRHVDEVGKRTDGMVSIGHHHERILGEQADHGEVVDGAIWQRLVERRGDRVAGRNAHQRIAVSRHARDLSGRDPAAGARPRVDDDLLTEPAGQPVGDDARDDVARPTRREAVDERDGAIGPERSAPRAGAAAQAARPASAARREISDARSGGVGAAPADERCPSMTSSRFCFAGRLAFLEPVVARILPQRRRRLRRQVSGDYADARERAACRQRTG